MTNAMADAFNQLKLSLGREGHFYVVRVSLVSGRYENEWPLDSASFLPDVLLLNMSGKACLIPIDRIDKLFLIDSRIKEI